MKAKSGSANLSREEQPASVTVADGYITLWSIQSEAAWRLAQERGVLRADGRRLCSREFRPAYKWLMGQMAQRLRIYDGRYPVWAWAYPKPDLRRSGLAKRGERHVLLECRLPVERVLLSDFETWHCVLNNQYLALTEAESDKWHEVWKNGPLATLRLWASWKRIFDLTMDRDPDWLGSLRAIQAVTNRIELKEIVSVRYFVAR